METVAKNSVQSVHSVHGGDGYAHRGRRGILIGKEERP
jgi:phage-related protein